MPKSGGTTPLPRGSRHWRGVQASPASGSSVRSRTAGAETLTGTAGDNTINGLAGNATLTGAGDADTLDGGIGTDTASYTGSGAGVTVNLATGTGSGGDAQGDTLTAIENLTGSAFADVLTGDGNAQDGRAACRGEV